MGARYKSPKCGDIISLRAFPREEATLVPLEMSGLPVSEDPIMAPQNLNDWATRRLRKYRIYVMA